MLFRFNVFKEDTNRVAENHRSLFDQQAEELKRLDRIQEEFKQLQQEKKVAVTKSASLADVFRHRVICLRTLNMCYQVTLVIRA